MRRIHGGTGRKYGKVLKCRKNASILEQY